MGGSLSELQRTILRRALVNRELEGRHEGDHGQCDVSRTEILVEYYGFHTVRDGKRHRRIGGHNFSLRQIGRPRYNTAQTCLTRAFNRLAERSVVVCTRGLFSQWAGAKLTPAGVRAAREFLRPVAGQ